MAHCRRNKTKNPTAPISRKGIAPSSNPVPKPAEMPRTISRANSREKGRNPVAGAAYVVRATINACGMMHAYNWNTRSPATENTPARRPSSGEAARPSRRRLTSAARPTSPWATATKVVSS